jgi:hypothetical protein
MKTLKGVRAEVADQWDDETHRRFEEQFIDPIEPKVKRALGAIRELADVLAKAEKECGSW